MIFCETHNLNSNSPYNMYPEYNLNLGLHFHRAYECIFVMQGCIDCVIGHNSYTLNKGEGIFVMPDQLHSFSTADSSEIMVLLFQPELIGHFHSTYKDSIPENNKFNFKNMNISLDNKPKNIYALKAFLYYICGEFVTLNNFIPKESTSQDVLIYKLIDYIDQNYAENCSLKEVALACGYDYYYISKFFSRLTGMSFVDYVNNLRINKACYMIKNTNDSFITIANNCGFGSLRSFNRNFYQYCNCTPSEYRQKQT